MDASTELAILADPEAQLRSLQDTFQKTQDKIRDWMKQLDTCLENNRTTQLETVARQQSEIAKLQENLKQLKNKQHLKRTASENIEEEVKKVKSMIGAIQRETDSLLLQKENLITEVSDIKERNVKQKELLEAQNAVTEQTTKELEKSVGHFRERLGFQLKRVSGGRLQMVFTCIDYKDPSHPYYCFFKITPDRRYAVSECTPEVPGFDELVATLNRDNDLTAFVLALRQAFKATV